MNPTVQENSDERRGEHKERELMVSRADYLREQAALLRGVADTFDVRSIRDRILALAEECVELAKLVEKSAAVEVAKSSSPLSRRIPQARR
jgi:hypothetical protein